ncbi:carboxypeptidase-like regulatory domain-containing protein [Parasediminibacterium paludis]|uniref:Carboxypeptidase-like regulatory domain-containing protein n=1 Tax=Parasediminibacterium paludis TaxID=908966 RepID=A0ABV8PY45_9BACT
MNQAKLRNKSRNTIFFYKVLIWIIIISINSKSLFAQKKYSFAADYYISSIKKGTIVEFLDNIKANSSYIIEYSKSFLDTNKIIQLSDFDNNLGKIFTKILAGQKVVVAEKYNKIILIPTNEVFSPAGLVPKYALYGIIKDSQSKEPLPNAVILDRENRIGAISNNYGYFTLSLVEGKHTLEVTYAGFEKLIRSFVISKDNRCDFELISKIDLGREVIVSASRNDNIKDGGNNVYNDADVQPFTNVLGEDDPMQSLTQLTSVNAQPESAGNFLIRGGSADQNVFLLDGNPIFNPTHLLGSLSIINLAALKSFKLYKSDFPARLGGGISAVMDVRTKDGNMQLWEGNINMSFLAGSIFAEGPLQKNKTALMFSARQSWANPFLRLLHKNYTAQFYDINIKLTHLLTKRDKIQFNIYTGKDNLVQQEDNTNNEQNWGNNVFSCSWNHLLKSKSFINTSLNYTSYKNIAGYKLTLLDSTGLPINDAVFNNYSKIAQFNFQTEVEISLTNLIKIKFGSKYTATSIQPNGTNISTNFINNTRFFSPFDDLHSHRLMTFIEAEMRLSKNFYLRPGLNLSFYDFKSYHFTSLQPRLFAWYKLSKHERIYVSFAHLSQNLHLLTNPLLGVNSDVLVPATANLKPEQSFLYNIGYTYKAIKKGLVIEAELFYKKLKDIINYGDGKNIYVNNFEIEKNIEVGRGWFYGLECRIQKSTTKLYTNLTYSLGWNWRQFNQINNGDPFPFKYDRRHTINLGVSYFLNKRTSVSGLWHFSTGDVFSLPQKLYPDFNSAQQISYPGTPNEYYFVYHFTGENQYRTLPYNKIDIAVSVVSQLAKKISGKLNFGIYNLSSAASQYIYDVEGAIGSKTLIVLKKYKHFDITPYLSYAISF